MATTPDPSPSGTEPRTAGGGSSNPDSNGNVKTTDGTSSTNPPTNWLTALGDVLQGGFWKRVGIGAMGVGFIIIGIVFLMNKDIKGVVKTAASVTPLG